MQTVQFDPYHVWLGIPAHEQPAHHYRLLGITLFEGQPDVIATAADRQMGHLRTFQSGKHSPLSQRLLNEVATAKICLLTPAKKAAYDEQLRRLQPSPPQYAPPAWADIAADLSSSARTRRVTKKRQTHLGPMIGVATAGVLLLVGFLAWSATRQPDKAPEQAVIAEVGQKQKSDRPETNARQPIGKSDSPPAPTESSPPVAASPAAKPPVAQAEPAPVTRPSFEKPADAPEKPAMPSFEAHGDTPQEQPPVHTKRLPVPDDVVQDKIAAQVASVYNPSRAKTPAGRIKLAYQLLQAAKASKEPNERYVFLRQARDLAGQAGDVALMLQAIEATGDFEIDLLEEKADSLLAFADKAANAEQISLFYGASQRVIVQALSEGRYQPASDLANAVCHVCQRSQGKEFRKKAVGQRDWVREYCRRQEQRREAEAKLKADPEDAAAHLLLGQNCCLDDDWKSGLPHLAKGSDAKLQALAKRELASPPAAANDQIKLADAWWTLAKTRQGEERDVLLLRASYWYDLAHAKLSSGLYRLKAEKRLEELVEVRQRRAADRQRFHPGKDSTKDLWNDLF